jgi:hypothetical protein
MTAAEVVLKPHTGTINQRTSGEARFEIQHKTGRSGRGWLESGESVVLEAHRP